MVVTRRELLFAAASALLAGRVNANGALQKTELLKIGTDAVMSWPRFQSQMTALAEAYVRGSVNQQVVAERGILYLKQLGINTAEFRQAEDDAYESGNRYWLWQRLMKDKYINGGILNIDSKQPVQLHDHPGATGIVRIISGEMEVWQFDENKTGKEIRSKEAAEQAEVELVRVSYRVLKPGDLALLTPENGNIHALRSISRQCRMLDFFIPPYNRSQRSWYEPLNNNWYDKVNVACRKIPQDAFSMV